MLDLQLPDKVRSKVEWAIAELTKLLAARQPPST
jgi:hypothetical protein